MSDFSFDLNEVEEVKGGVIPAGLYQASIEESTLETTKNGEGLYIKCQFRVTGEEQNNRVFWEMFNVKNANAESVKIGIGRIKSMVIAAGGQPGLFNDPEMLIGLEMNVKLTVKKSQEYGKENKISSFSPCVAQAMPMTNGAAANTQGAQQSSGPRF